MTQGLGQQEATQAGRREHGVLGGGREKSGDATLLAPGAGPASLKKLEMAGTLSPQPGQRPDFSPGAPAWSPRAVGQHTVLSVVSHAVCGPAWSPPSLRVLLLCPVPRDRHPGRPLGPAGLPPGEGLAAFVAYTFVIRH